MGLREDILSEIFRSQEDGEPEKVYKKVIVGKVALRVIDNFTGEKAEVLIVGDPDNTDPDDLEISLWTPMEVRYFEKANKGLIEAGSIVEVSKKSKFEVDRVNALDDKALKELSHSRYFTLVSRLDEITSETTLQRLLKIAEEENRPAKTLNVIKGKLEELQQR
jgi:hypothetical protein